MSQELPKKYTCGSCEHLGDAPPGQLVGPSQSGTCRRYPPTVHLVPRQTAMGVQMEINSFFPVVAKSMDRCGEYEWVT